MCFIGNITQEKCKKTGLHRNLFTDINNSISHNNVKWKQHNDPSTSKYISKMWHIHIMEYHSTKPQIIVHTLQE